MGKAVVELSDHCAKIFATALPLLDENFPNNLMTFQNSLLQMTRSLL